MAIKANPGLANTEAVLTNEDGRLHCVGLTTQTSCSSGSLQLIFISDSVLTDFQSLGQQVASTEICCLQMYPMI